MKTTTLKTLITFLVVIGLFIAASTSSRAAEQVDADPSSPSPQPTARKRPHHVFIIVLENEGFDATFGPNSQAPYLRDEIRKKGKLLTQYYAVGHLSLPNYIAMISGQAPNAMTQNNCKTFYDFRPLADGLDKDGQAIGEGCVYPLSVKTIANQLEAKNLSWAGYMEDMAVSCQHPEIGKVDETQEAMIGHQYAARHNPFVYFHSIIDDPTTCGQDKPLAELDSDLQSVKTSSHLAFITPNLCNDGHDSHCIGEPANLPGGLPAVDRFFRRSKVVEKIMSSEAYKQDGMLIITFDEADLGNDAEDYGSCCGELPGPNSVAPGLRGWGGGRVGTIVISPFTTPDTCDDTPYNHYSLLKSMEDLFGLSYLGHAAQDGLQAFGGDVYDTDSSTRSKRCPAVFSASGFNRSRASRRRRSS